MPLKVCCMRFRWSRLSKLELGRLAEQVVRMQFAMHDYAVFVPEVDEAGVDFLARSRASEYFEVQVKSVRGNGYVFLPKDRSPLADSRLVAIGHFVDDAPPQLFLVPSVVWKTPSDLFVSRDYEGKKSKPEWGVSLNERTIPHMQAFRLRDWFDRREDFQQDNVAGGPRPARG